MVQQQEIYPVSVKGELTKPPARRLVVHQMAAGDSAFHHSGISMDSVHYRVDNRLFRYSLYRQVPQGLVRFQRRRAALDMASGIL